MIPYPNQNIKEWIEKKETYVNILQPLQVLNGQCLAYLMLDNPKEIDMFLGKKGKNS